MCLKIKVLLKLMTFPQVNQKILMKTLSGAEDLDVRFRELDDESRKTRK
jgi:hypothetical protein